MLSKINNVIRRGIILPVGKECDVTRYDFYLCFEHVAVVRDINDYYLPKDKSSTEIFYGGFVVDENGIVVKATMNNIYVCEAQKEVRPVQMIIEDDDISFSDFFLDINCNTGLMVPHRFTSLTCWRDLIRKHIDGGLYLSDYRLLTRDCICTKDFVEERIKDSEIERQLNNQLTCTRIIKDGIDNIAKSNLVLADSVIEGSRIIAWKDSHYGAFAGI
jgi:hypothetical protein